MTGVQTCALPIFWSLKNHSKKSTSTYYTNQNFYVTQGMEKIATHRYNNKNSKSQYEENLEFKILVAKEEMLVVENTVWYFIDKENLLQFFQLTRIF